MKKSYDPFAEFAGIFKLKVENVYLACNNPSYSTFTVPKGDGKLRTVHNPNPVLKKIQRKIAKKLTYMYCPTAPKPVMGFVKTLDSYKKRDIYENAKAHRKSRYLVNIDIQDFFPTINIRHVVHALSSRIPIKKEHVPIIEKLLLKDSTLPPGSPASPIISNLVFEQIDHQIIAFCKKENLKFTRYVDDLTFSSKHKIPKTLIDQITELIQQHGFNLNYDKYVYFRKKDIKEVTGIAIYKKRLEISESTLEEIKGNIAYYHEWKQKAIATFGLNERVEKQLMRMQRTIKGQLSFAKKVEGAEGENYQSLLNSFERSLNEKTFSSKVYL